MRSSTAPQAQEDQTDTPTSDGSGWAVKGAGSGLMPTAELGMTLGWLSATPGNLLVQNSQTTSPVVASRQYTNPNAPPSPSPQPTYTLPLTTSGEVQESVQLTFWTGWLWAGSGLRRSTDHSSAKVAASRQYTLPGIAVK